MMSEVAIGEITDFFAKPVVAGIKLNGILRQGDRIHIKGATTDMEIVVESMQIDRADITEAKASDLIGVKIPERARCGDIVYKITE